ncbi:hypothetical protein J1614_001428 [Plenodomus biglobosus]|nr:hypothetical protein J1614_001428 [Plenodomus biglobosus]
MAELRIAIAVEVPLITLALTTVSLRVYSRLTIKRKLATDDVLIVLATATAVVRTVISCMSAADDGGYDSKGPDRASEVAFYQHVFERRIAYMLAVTLTRLSILVYYLRIFPPGLSSLRRCTYILIVLALIHFAEVLTVLSIFCKDIAQLWSDDWPDFSGSQCFSSAVYSYSAAIGDSIVDSLIFALPIPYVWRLSKICIRQRLGLVLVFGLGFIVCVVALMQIPFIQRRERNMRYFGSAVNILIAIQISFAIIAASLPDLRALVARKFSLLNRRSRPEQCDTETGSSAEGPRKNRNPVSGLKKVFRKPDWLRETIPASLMSTAVTQAKAARSHCMRAKELAERSLAESIRVGKLPEPSNVFALSIH